MVRAMSRPRKLRALDAVNVLPNELRSASVLRAAENMLLERVQLAKSMGQTFEGARDMNTVLGYQTIISPSDYRYRYSRGGIAGAIVDAYPVATWRGSGHVYEDEDSGVETVFETVWTQLEHRLRIWSMFQKADILAGQGHYSCLLLGAPGDVSQELPKGRPEHLIYLSPYGEDEAKIEAWETNPEDARFGLPKSYILRRVQSAAQSGSWNASTPKFEPGAFDKPVHWSRILHFAEGCTDNEIFGLPRLERVWNLLDDLMKVTGGGSEAFWLRANAGMHIDVDADAKLDDAEKNDLREKAELWTHQLRRWMVTRKAKMTEMGSDVANFEPQVNAILKQIAGCVRMPLRVLVGAEQAQLGGQQDADNWDTQVDDRRTGYAEPSIVRPFVDRLIEYQYLPAPVAYFIDWPEKSQMTETEKAAGVKSWADTNRANGTPVFTSDEMRDHWYGLDPIELPGAPDAAPTGDGLEEQVAMLEAALRSPDNNGRIEVVVKR